MSSLTRWRSHAHRGFHRVGRDLGIPHKARTPVALGLLLAAGVGGYLQYTRPKVGDVVQVDASAFGSQVPGLTAGQTVQAKVVSVTGSFFAPVLGVQPIVAGQQIPATLSLTTKSPGFKNTTPRLLSA